MKPPEGLIDWVKKQKLDWHDYIIYRAGWQADPLAGIKHRCVDCVCTHCGTHFKAARADGTPFGFFSPVSGDAVQSGEKLLCPECGAETTAMHVSSATHLERYVWPMSAEAQDGKLLLYLWRVCRDIEKTGEVVWSAVPWECYTFGAKTAEKYVRWGRIMTTTYTLSQWEHQARLTDTMYDIDLVYCPEGLANVYAQTECANCKLETYMNITDVYRFPVAWVRTWQRHRSAEALMAPNARRLTAELITWRKAGGYWKKWNTRTDVLRDLNWKGRKSHEVLRLAKEELTYFATANDAAKRYEALLLARRYNVPCRCGEEDTSMDTPTQEQFLQRGVLPGKAVRYLEKQKKRYKRRLWPTYLLDYWDMAEALGEDLSDRDVMWPQNLQTAHDRMVERKQTEAAERRKKSFQQRYERMKKYAFEDGDILIRPCETEGELIAEGKALHHCVASYAERHARGKLTIFFIRRKDEPDKPWYTLNFNEKTLSVTENRGLWNCDRTDEVREFESKWLEWIRSSRKRRTSAA